MYTLQYPIENKGSSSPFTDDFPSNRHFISMKPSRTGLIILIVNHNSPCEQRKTSSKTKAMIPKREFAWIQGKGRDDETKNAKGRGRLEVEKRSRCYIIA